MELKMYYVDTTDAVIVEIDGEVKYHDEALHSSEYLNYFCIDSVEEFEELDGNFILETLEDMTEEFELHSPDYVEEYLDFIKNTIIPEGADLLCVKYI